MTAADFIRLEDEHGPNTYQKFPVVIVKGSGATVWDEKGQAYIDCMGGYGVAIVGHCNPYVVAAIKEQADTLITCHGSLYNDKRAEFLDVMAKSSPPGLDATYLSSSGAEAVEAAIKVTRRYTAKKGIIAMKGGYHGKTLGALSATWNKRYREAFEPLLPDFKHVEWGDIEDLRKGFEPDTAGVILEPIQGESGIIVPPEGYLKAVKEECEKRGVLLIMDEIQTGLGRTGKMWASELSGVVPDVFTSAKGLAGGIPIGATVTRKEVMQSLKRGEQTSTFGGNPMACAAGTATLKYIKDFDLPGQAAAKGAEFTDGMRKIAQAHKLSREVRGVGLMLAFEMRVDIQDILMNSLKRYVLFTYSGRNIVRMLPPIVITKDQIKESLEVLEGVIAAEEAKRSG